MTEKRYTITLGKNNEFKEIIDHSKQDKHISVIEFLKQVGEQDKAFKELKKENKELKKENVNIMSDLDYYRAKSGSCEEGLFEKDREIAKLEKENRELDNRLNNYIVDYNGLNCEYNWLKTEKEQLENENKELEQENEELQQMNKKWIKYVHQLEIALKKKGD